MCGSAGRAARLCPGDVLDSLLLLAVMKPIAAGVGVTGGNFVGLAPVVSVSLRRLRGVDGGGGGGAMVGGSEVVVVGAVELLVVVVVVVDSLAERRRDIVAVVRRVRYCGLSMQVL